VTQPRCQLTIAGPFAGSSTCRWARSRPSLAGTSSGVHVGTSGKIGRPPGSRTSGARTRRLDHRELLSRPPGGPRRCRGGFCAAGTHHRACGTLRVAGTHLRGTALSIVGGVPAVIALVLISDAMILSRRRPGSEKGTATPKTIEVPPSPLPSSVRPAPH
jgi:hypothetical protein